MHIAKAKGLQYQDRKERKKERKKQGRQSLIRVGLSGSKQNGPKRRFDAVLVAPVCELFGCQYVAVNSPSHSSKWMVNGKRYVVKLPYDTGGIKIWYFLYRYWGIARDIHILKCRCYLRGRVAARGFSCCVVGRKGRRERGRRDRKSNIFMLFFHQRIRTHSIQANLTVPFKREFTHRRTTSIHSSPSSFTCHHKMLLEYGKPKVSKVGTKQLIRWYRTRSYNADNTAVRRGRAWAYGR